MGRLRQKREHRRTPLLNYLHGFARRQNNTTWPAIIRNNRGVDELLWKGNRRAPTVQRIGIVVVALAYVLIGFSFVDLFVTQKLWPEAAFAFLLFTAAGWFIRNAVRK